MEIIADKYSLEIGPNCFPLSTDSMVLSYFAKLPRNAKVLDLGSGCGTLGLLLCAKDSSCHVTGVELDETAHRCAGENIARNHLTSRMESILGDVRTCALPHGSFDCCVSNPPYFPSGPASKLTPTARREDTLTLQELLAAASRALKFGGDMYLIHRPERLAEIFHQGCTADLEPKKLILIRHKSGGPVSLVLVHMRKGAKPGLTWSEVALQTGEGEPTSIYRKIYNL